MTRDFVKELQAIIQKTNNNYVPLLREIDKVPEGLPVYTVYRRSNTGLNQPKLIGLPKQEADKWCKVLNAKEKTKRMKERDEAYERGIEYKPEVVILYDVVEQASNEEKIFWNPSPVIKGILEVVKNDTRLV